MSRYHGQCAAAGQASAEVFVLRHAGLGLHRVVAPPLQEQALTQAAMQQARQQLAALQQAAPQQESDIFVFQAALLDDPSLNAEIAAYIAAGGSGAAAVERATALFARRLEQIQDEYLAQRGQDVLDVGRRIVNLLDGFVGGLAQRKTPCILLCDTLYPSEIAAFTGQLVLGVVAAQGSTKSHTAMLARAMGMPFLVQAGAEIMQIAGGSAARLNATEGYLQIEAQARAASVASAAAHD